MSLTKFAGRFKATNYAYGLSIETPPLQIGIGSIPSGTGTVTLALGQTNTADGQVFQPLNVNAPVLIGSGSNQETVTPSAVSNPTPTQYNTATLTATFSNAHGTGDLIASGTAGLQEALNAASAAGGGVVVIDPYWVTLGGTQAMLTAATIPAGVTIEDLRAGDENATYYTSGSIPNAQVLTLNSVGFQLVAAPGAGNMLEHIATVLENVFKTGAYASGGAIGVSYGLAGTACSTTVAATFLTSPTVNHICLLTASLADSASSAVLNKPLTLQAATADFTTGAGSLNYRTSYRRHVGL